MAAAAYYPPVRRGPVPVIIEADDINAPIDVDNPPALGILAPANHTRPNHTRPNQPPAAAASPLKKRYRVQTGPAPHAGDPIYPHATHTRRQAAVPAAPPPVPMRHRYVTRSMVRAGVQLPTQEPQVPQLIHRRVPRHVRAADHHHHKADARAATGLAAPAPVACRRRERQNLPDTAIILEDCHSPALNIPKPPSFDCPICLDATPVTSCFSASDCAHRLCRPCATRLVTVAALETQRVPISCPECPQTLDTTLCLSLLDDGTPAHAVARDALQTLSLQREAISQLAYCSNINCNTPFDWEPGPQFATDSTKVHCPLCARDTCVKCRCEWHTGLTCAMYQAQRETGDGFRELAAKLRWKPCPRCGFVIERTHGCRFVRCKCDCGFCYKCGKEYLRLGNALADNGNSHGVPGCSCSLFDKPVNMMR